MADLAKRVGTTGAAFTALTSYQVINNVSEFPTAISNVITLLANTVYFISGDVDLVGDRLVGALNTCIIGGSSENASITSTGLSVGVALFTTDYTTPIRHITFKDVDTALDIDGSRSAQTPALDWTGVNFLNVPNVGTIKDCSNWIFSKGAFLNSQGLDFDGTLGTIGIDNSIFSGDGTAGNILNVLSTAIITRRFRPIYSSFVVFGSTVGITVDVSATIPVQGYILDTISFSGGGTYIAGVLNTDNKSRFLSCTGITNSSEIGNFYMTANATETVIALVNTPTKVLGTTTPNTINQKFNHTDNRLTYIGALKRDFQVSANASFFSGNNKKIGVYVALNGVVVASSEMYGTTDGNGRAESIALQAIMGLDVNDYIEIWAENATNNDNVTFEYLNTICKALN